MSTNVYGNVYSFAPGEDVYGVVFEFAEPPEIVKTPLCAVVSMDLIAHPANRIHLLTRSAVAMPLVAQPSTTLEDCS